MTELLQVRGLSVRAGDQELVDGVDLRVGAGERVALVGESGSGKTMTALAIMGLLPRGVTASGSVELAGHGELLRSGPGAEKAMSRVRGNRISMVFQEPMTALDPLMRVGDQVAEVIRTHQAERGGGAGDDGARGEGARGGAGGRAEARRRATALLAEVRLPDPQQAARAFPHQLSGGQRQRVVLAMALAGDPDLLIADEPTTALDVTVQKQMLELIDERLTQRGAGLLLVTHDPAVVAALCERVVHLHQGQVVPGPGTPLPPAQPLTSAAPSPAIVVSSRRSPGQEVPPSRHQLTTNVKEDGTAMVRVDQVSRTYGRRGFSGKGRVIEALRDVSFEVPSGQRLGIVGESGSGKSTLLRLIAGLDRPTSGSVHVASQQVSGPGAPRPGVRRLRWLRETAQVVFQDPRGSLDPQMRTGAIVGEPLRGVAREEREARVAQALDDVGLPADAAQRYPHEFSGGQRQRIAIARAVVVRPRLLLADEPVSALDVSVREQILELLDRLAAERELTLVLVSHDLQVVRRICEEVLVMKDGEIVEQGPSAQVLHSPRAPYTRELLAAALPSAARYSPT
ncbi:ATP-binding cassette domain-containing protein [Bogoriella caseilytica]|uniref:Peptide/nickel transport system ATP-binding protein n=1 Tax=Bogoriella caseilytica TaxID=56055 RepID=A0A3N2BCI7_9MICO|nr:ABC transporter ATP-binding protein [Bogoriella caseilytica]ROR72945.1 peptide/nickel transport system ATP-binding protein [Bogoriella caseilytica]